MKRLLPWPQLSLALVAMWLLLAREFNLGQIVLGIAFGIGAPALLAPLRPARPRVRRPLVLARLIGTVGRDVIASSLEVFRTLLRGRSRPVHSRFVVIPLELRDPSAIASLAMITTVVPGTVWCELARDNSAVMLHVWHAPDEAAFIDLVKRRYEQPLKEIFES